MKPERAESCTAEAAEEAPVIVNHVVSRSGLACWLDYACQPHHQTTAEGHVRSVSVCVRMFAHYHHIKLSFTKHFEYKVFSYADPVDVRKNKLMLYATIW